MAFSVQSSRIHPVRLSVAAAAWMFAAVDIGLTIAALFLSDNLYSGSIFGYTAKGFDLFLLGLGMGIAFAMQIALRGGYSLRAVRDSRRQFSITVVAWLSLFFLVGWLGFLTKTTAVASRVSILIFFVLGFVLLWLGRSLFAMAMTKAIAEARIVVRSAFIIISGDNAQRAALTKDLSESGVEIVGACHLDLEDDHISPERITALANEAIGAACATLATRNYDAVHVYVPWQREALIRELQRNMASCAVPVVLFADPFVDQIVKAPVYDTGHHVGFELKRSPLTRLERAIKRSFDLAVSSMLLLLLAPLLLMVALAVLVESGRPIIFKQSRKGFGGKPFEIFKFRTMTVTENGDSIRQAQRNDRRVTKFGAVLRRTSIDELPQLFNVLIGEMSLIGPRPHAVAHDNIYVKVIEDYAFRQHVKPGLTGWAQVNGYRGETKNVDEMAARVEHDVWYINHWSMFLDMKILLMTVRALLLDKDVY